MKRLNKDLLLKEKQIAFYAKVTISLLIQLDELNPCKKIFYHHWCIITNPERMFGLLPTKEVLNMRCGLTRYTDLGSFSRQKLICNFYITD